MKKVSGPDYQTAVLAVVALAFLPWVPQSLPAQQTTPLRGDPAQRPKFRAMMDAINQRAFELGLIETSDDPAQAEFVRRRRNELLTEDFEKLYTINTEKIAGQLSAPSPDFKTLSEATADLKKRASRIKQDLRLLQVVDKGAKIRYEENFEDLTRMLPELNRLITSFLDSPVFRLNSPNDSGVRLKASRDLDGIIKLSEAINKIAKRSLKLTAQT